MVTKERERERARVRVGGWAGRRSHWQQRGRGRAIGNIFGPRDRILGLLWLTPGPLRFLSQVWSRRRERLVAAAERQRCTCRMSVATAGDE